MPWGLQDVVQPERDPGEPGPRLQGPGSASGPPEHMPMVKAARFEGRDASWRHQAGGNKLLAPQPTFC